MTINESSLLLIAFKESREVWSNKFIGIPIGDRSDNIAIQKTKIEKEFK